jgi:hypothetical protein
MSAGSLSTRESGIGNEMVQRRIGELQKWLDFAPVELLA